jgi:glycine hydroxymethyltransferase
MAEIGTLVARAIQKPEEAEDVRARVSALLAIHQPYLSEY